MNKKTEGRTILTKYILYSLRTVYLIKHNCINISISSVVIFVIFMGVFVVIFVMLMGVFVAIFEMLTGVFVAIFEMLMSVFVMFMGVFVVVFTISASMVSMAMMIQSVVVVVVVVVMVIIIWGYFRPHLGIVIIITI